MELITMRTVARRALATLYNNTVLAGLVFRDYDQDFSGKQGDTVTVRTPAVLEALEFDRSQGIVLQDPTEGSFDVKLDTLLDVSFPITAEELTLELDEFDERLLTPAMEAIIQGVDGRLAAGLVAAARGANGGGRVSMTGGKPNSAFRKARARLGRKKLPLTERYGVLSPEGAASALGDDLFVAADKSGWTDALREATVGRVFGFDTYESQVIGPEEATPADADGVAFHRSAVALVTRTLERPMGAAAENVAIENYKGLGLRVVKGYDQKYKQDIISVDVLIGLKTVRPYAAIELDLDAEEYGSEVS